MFPNCYMTDLYILNYFNEFAKSKSFDFSNSDRQLYLLLFRFIEKNGTFDKSKKMHYVQLSVDDFASSLGCAKGSLTLAFKNLSSFGLLERVEGEPIVDRVQDNPNGLGFLRSGLFEPHKTYMKLDI